MAIVQFMNPITTSYMVYSVIIAPFIAAMLSLASSRVGRWASLVASMYTSLACSILLAYDGARVLLLYGEVIVDRFSVWTSLLVSLVYLASSLASLSLVDYEVVKPYNYYPVFNTAYGVMMLCSLSNNMFMMWVCLEVSTVLTVYLVALHGGLTAVEASWKYYILCAVGMAFSLYGLILLYSNAVRMGVASPWLITSLKLSHMASNIEVLLASCLIVAGFSVKAGLFPLHFWLPDAHSEAPSPVSALLSGALIYLPLYCLLRILSVLSGAARLLSASLLLVIGLASIAYAAAGMYWSTSVKRLLAYSSIEHMGVLAYCIALLLGYGVPHVAMRAFTVEAMGHALAKAGAFIAAGILVLEAGGRGLEDLAPVHHVDRVAGGLFLGFLIALLGIPPLPIFVSEVLACIATRLSLLLLVFILLLLASFASLSSRMLRAYTRGGLGDKKPLKLRGVGYGYTSLILLMTLLILLTIVSPLPLVPSTPP